jgi:hypothetical protein
VDEYRSISNCKVGNGSLVLFWKDFWSEGELLCDKFPRLFSYALDENISVAAAASADEFSSCFALPLSVEAFHELQAVSVLMENTDIDATVLDQRDLFGARNTHPQGTINSYLSVCLRTKL